MKLFAIVNTDGFRMSWDNIKDSFDEEGNKIDYQSPYHTKDDGWYEIEREPDLSIGEYLKYNKELNTIEIKQRVKTQEQVNQERFRKDYPTEKILDLQDLAIQAIASGETLSEAYQTYLTFKENLNGRKE